MPIRFRCPNCQQLLGISRRKAGLVVPCPTCQKEILVPSMDDPPVAPVPSAPPALPAQPALPAPPLFERSDFDELLHGAPSQVGASPGSAGPPPPSPRKTEPPISKGSFSNDVELVEAPTEPPGKAHAMYSTMSPVTMSIWVVILLLILGSAFAIGVLVGRYL